jgi:hypothetical protein
MRRVCIHIEVIPLRVGRAHVLHVRVALEGRLDRAKAFAAGYVNSGDKGTKSLDSRHLPWEAAEH